MGSECRNIFLYEPQLPDFGHHPSLPIFHVLLVHVIENRHVLGKTDVATMQDFVSELIKIEFIKVLSLFIKIHLHSHRFVLQLLDLVQSILSDVLLNVDLQKITVSSRIL